MLCDCIMNNHIASPDIDSAATNTIDILCQLIVNAELNSQVQYGIIACWRAAACHLQTISVVLNNAMRCINTDKLLTNKVITIYNMQKILQPKYTFNLAVSKIMYNHTTSQLPATFNNYFKLITDVHSYNTRQIKTQQFALIKITFKLRC